MTSWRYIADNTDRFATERGSAHFVDFRHTCGERVVLAKQIGHITKVDAAYGGNNRASVSLWMRVPLDDTEPTDANPAKGALSDYKCIKCGEKIGELYIRNPDPYDGDDDVRCKLMVRSKSNPDDALLVPVAPEGSSESLDALLAKQTPFTGTLGAPKRSVERRLAYAFLWCARPLSGESSPYYLALCGVIGFLKALEQAEVKAGEKERIGRLIDAFEDVQQMDVWHDAPIIMRQIVCDDLLCRLKAAVEHAQLDVVPERVEEIVDQCAKQGQISVIGYAHALWIDANVKNKNDERITSVFASAEAVFAESVYDDVDQFLRDYCAVTSRNGCQPIVVLAKKHAWYPSLVAAYAARGGDWLSNCDTNAFARLPLWDRFMAWGKLAQQRKAFLAESHAVARIKSFRSQLTAALDDNNNEEIDEELWRWCAPMAGAAVSLLDKNLASQLLTLLTRDSTRVHAAAPPEELSAAAIAFHSREQCLLNVAGYVVRAAIELDLPDWFDRCWALARAVCLRDWREPMSLNNRVAKVMLKPLEHLKLQGDVLMPFVVPIVVDTLVDSNNVHPVTNEPFFKQLKIVTGGGKHSKTAGDGSTIHDTVESMLHIVGATTTDAKFGSVTVTDVSAQADRKALWRPVIEKVLGKSSSSSSSSSSTSTSSTSTSNSTNNSTNNSTSISTRNNSNASSSTSSTSRTAGGTPSLDVGVELSVKCN